MKLEVGKYYLDRTGMEWGPMKFNADLITKPWSAKNQTHSEYDYWRSDGFYMDSRCHCKRDLIEEAPERFRL